MIFRDTIIQIIKHDTADGSGGHTSETEKSTKIMCACSEKFRLSELPDGYGWRDTRELAVITAEPIDETAEYEFNNRRFTVAHQNKQGRLCYSTMIEVK